jgi:hypothetical protein
MKGDGTLIDYGELFLERADWLKYQLYVVLSRPYVKDVTITDLAVMMNSNLDYSPRYLGHEIASGRSESNVWSVANTD